jgi:hypothetical protein
MVALPRRGSDATTSFLFPPLRSSQNIYSADIETPAYAAIPMEFRGTTKKAC